MFLSPIEGVQNDEGVTMPIVAPGGRAVAVNLLMSYSSDKKGVCCHMPPNSLAKLPAKPVSFIGLLCRT